MIKWEGYPSTKNTWEPKENILSTELVEEFEKQWTESSTSKPSTKSPTKVSTHSYIHTYSWIYKGFFFYQELTLCTFQAIVKQTSRSRSKSPEPTSPEEMESHTYNLVPNVKAGWQYNNEAEELLGLKEFVVKGKKQLMFFVKWYVLLD